MASFASISGRTNWEANFRPGMGVIVKSQIDTLLSGRGSYGQITAKQKQSEENQPRKVASFIRKLDRSTFPRKPS